VAFKPGQLALSLAYGVVVQIFGDILILCCKIVLQIFSLHSSMSCNITSAFAALSNVSCPGSAGAGCSTWSAQCISNLQAVSNLSTGLVNQAGHPVSCLDSNTWGITYDTCQQYCSWPAIPLVSTTFNLPQFQWPFSLRNQSPPTLTLKTSLVL
jgi:hypothetical protein